MQVIHCCNFFARLESSCILNCMPNNVWALLQLWQAQQRITINTSHHCVKSWDGLDEAGPDLNFLNRFGIEYFSSSTFSLVILFCWNIYVCIYKFNTHFYNWYVIKWQPLVPAVGAEDGKWLVAGKYFPVCKPGGHGAIWKLAHDKGVFQHFRDHGRKGATVRQVRLQSNISLTFWLFY